MPRTKGAKNKEREDKFQFFAEADYVIKDGKKRISSEYPMWYNTVALDEIEEDIRRDEHAIKMGYVKESNMPVVRDRLSRSRERMEQVKESIPILNAKQKDFLDTTCKYLGEEIRNKMFSYSSMMKGTADAHAEADRMIKPSITVTPEVAHLAEACNVRVEDGKISRDGASKIWKISQRALGELSDTEILRRD
jgi:hypothetical protein